MFALSLQDGPKPEPARVWWLREKIVGKSSFVWAKSTKERGLKVMDEVFASQNLYQCAYLLSKGFKLAGKRQDGVKVTLTFSGKGVQATALDFFNHGTAEAKALTDSYRSLKDFVFQR